MACIGYFDALHRGHRSLIDKTLFLAKKNNIKSSLITFNPDPMDYISNNKTRHIFSNVDRYKMIEELGFDYLIIIEFNEKLMKYKADYFINNYLNKMNIDTLICGDDFRFGYKASGNISYLRKSGNFQLEVIKQIKYYNIKISSSRIKDNINRGNFKLVDKLLGFKYYLSLKVINISKNGSKYLISAISDYYLPRNGKYDGFYIKDNIVYIKTDKKYKINDEFKLYP